jgi:hypothetical protein
VTAVIETATTQEASERVEASQIAAAARIEDLEEALRRIVVVLEPDGRHELCDRDLAAIAVACDVLDLDVPEVDWLGALGSR